MISMFDGNLAALILLSTVYLIQPAEVPHYLSLTVAELGGNVTLQCPVPKEEGKFFHWYKQSVGHMVQRVAAVILGSMTVSEPINPRFTIIKAGRQYRLTIRNVSKEDEATYFCQHGVAYSQSFVNGIFLAVNDPDQQKSVNVKQSQETASVQPGDSVTLKCSLRSKNKARCPGEPSVYWFRAASGESHPAMIYTNSSYEEEERNCVYSLSKTIRDSSDTGTYYCTVATCGQILFGEGTKVEIKSELDPVYLVLGVLLACCVTVIVILIFYVKRSRICEFCKEYTIFQRF
ncbi:uncharacterized protein LOC104934722 [Larimichthys crocea]|uniref:uncharacterized protein LOC104934722 n=1 Tax=Larimichthys crocea TaxID=215358 RepID=UPI000F5EC39F|nr:uncharacterized protein LOC104934722 [Larimichthys crocea]